MPYLRVVTRRGKLFAIRKGTVRSFRQFKRNYENFPIVYVC